MFSKIELANQSLGKKLVGRMLGVQAVGLGGSKTKPDSRIQITCTLNAKRQILKKYGKEYRGFKLYFKSGSPTAVFGEKSPKEKVTEKKVRPKGDEFLPGKGVYW